MVLIMTPDFTTDLYGGIFMVRDDLMAAGLHYSCNNEQYKNIQIQNNCQNTSSLHGLHRDSPLDLLEIQRSFQATRTWRMVMIN